METKNAKIEIANNIARIVVYGDMGAKKRAAYIKYYWEQDRLLFENFDEYIELIGQEEMKLLGI